IADVRKGVALERALPLLLVLLVAPGFPMGGEHLRRSFLERRNAFSLAPLEDRIEPHFDPGPYLARPLPCTRERYPRSTSKAEVAADTVLLHPANPALAAARLDDEEQTIAVAQLARFGGRFHSCCGELTHSSIFPHF